jgi:hypothetical protein
MQLKKGLYFRVWWYSHCMDISLIEAIAKLTVEGVLIYLIVIQQKQITLLLSGIVEMAKTHVKDVIDITCRDDDAPKTYS